MPAQPPSQNPPGAPGRLRWWQRGVLALFGAALLLALLRLFVPLWENSAWPDAALLILATAATLAALAKQLPVPNIILAAGLAASLAGIAHAVNNVTGFPFGKFEFNPALGPRLLGVLPLALPALWAIAALNARDVARLVLHTSRQHPRHGYHVIGLTVLLMIVFHLALNPFASTVKHWWTANPTPLLDLASSTLLSLAIQVAITPLLLDKFPVPRPPNFSPLFVWLALIAWLATGLFIAEFPGAALLATTIGAIITGLALRTRRGTIAQTTGGI